MADIVFNQILIRDDNEFLCLTDMWKAAGGVDAKRPSDWRDLPATCDFIEYIQESGNAGFSGIALIRSERGGKNPGTWAHWHLALAYAKYLSPEFHVWCNTVVRAHMEGRLVPAQETSLALPQVNSRLDRLEGMFVQMLSRFDRLLPGNQVQVLPPSPEDDPRFLTKKQIKALKDKAKALGHITPVWRDIRSQFKYGSGPSFSTVLQAEFDDVLAYLNHRISFGAKPVVVEASPGVDMNEILRPPPAAAFLTEQLHVKILPKDLVYVCAPVFGRVPRGAPTSKTSKGGPTKYTKGLLLEVRDHWLRVGINLLRECLNRHPQPTN